jgi:hypothetical protein
MNGLRKAYEDMFTGLALPRARIVWQVDETTF